MVKLRTTPATWVRVAPAALAAVIMPLALPAQEPAQPPADRDQSAVEVLTLERALDLARENNPTLRAARTSVRIPGAELAQARRFSNPFLSLGVDPGLNAGTGVGATLAKRFEIAGQRGLRADASGARVEAFEWASTDVERRLQMDVGRAFYGTRVRQEVVVVVDSIVAVSGRLLEAAELKFEAGFASEFDRNIARIQLLQIKVQRARIARELAVGKAELRTLLGQPADRDLEATGPLVHEPVPDSMPLSRLQSYAQDTRADVRAADLLGRAASAAVDLARRMAVPDLVLGLGANKDADGTETLGVSASFSIPLFDRNQFGRDLALAKQSILSAERQAISLAVSQEVRSAYARLEAARVQLSTYGDDILELADASQRFATRAYARGELDITTAVLAQRQHTDAHIGYLEAVLAFDTSAIELEGAVGASLAELFPGNNQEDGP